MPVSAIKNIIFFSFLKGKTTFLGHRKVGACHSCYLLKDMLHLKMVASQSQERDMVTYNS